MTLPKLRLSKTKKAFLASLSGIAFIVVGTYLAVQFAKGYRPSRVGIAGTGLLAANSFPPGAEVYLNGKLVSATDDTLNLPPGDYEVEINRTGFIPWKKKLTIQAELVTQTNAELFRVAPSLSPLTLAGSTNITPSPNGQKIAYAVASASAQARNGLYVVELENSALQGNSPQARQIAKNVNGFDFATASLLWSPNSNQILAYFPEDGGSAYLLESNANNQLDEMPDVSIRLPVILSEWEEEIVTRETKQLALLPEPIAQIATQSATNVYFSPNEEKIMYTAMASAQIPTGIVPPLPSSNTQPEERTLEPGGIYVYDVKEDKNFLLGTITPPAETNQPSDEVAVSLSVNKQLLVLTDYQQTTNLNATPSSTLQEVLPTVFNRLQDDSNLEATFANFRVHYSSIYSHHYQWYPNSNHLLIREADRIDIVEYDNTNRNTLYAGPFDNNFLYPWPDGTKLVIMTNLNTTNQAANLYTVDVK